MKGVKRLKIRQISDSLIGHILQFNLDETLYADSKTVFPMIIRESCGRNTYKVMIETGKKDIREYSRFEIELRGRVDIEYLRYRGRVELESIWDEPGYYMMKILSLYKIEQRKHKRVPYRRAIQITAPVQMEGLLNNISASGAMIYVPNKIEGKYLGMTFTLLKNPMQLTARIIEQQYINEMESFMVRCHFEGMDLKNKKTITEAVRMITMTAKKRLNE